MSCEVAVIATPSVRREGRSCRSGKIAVAASLQRNRPHSVHSVAFRLESWRRSGERFGEALPVMAVPGDDCPMRVEAGAVVDEFDLDGIGRVVARHTRMRDDDGVVWACMFTVVATGNSDLAIVHRLSAK